MILDGDPRVLNNLFQNSSQKAKRITRFKSLYSVALILAFSPAKTLENMPDHYLTYSKHECIQGSSESEREKKTNIYHTAR